LALCREAALGRGFEDERVFLEQEAEKNFARDDSKRLEVDAAALGRWKTGRARVDFEFGMSLALSGVNGRALSILAPKEANFPTSPGRSPG